MKLHRIQLVLKGGPERDTLLDIIQRSKSHHQKRAYQCMKCLTNLLSASTLAAEIFFEDPDNKFRLVSSLTGYIVFYYILILIRTLQQPHVTQV